PAGPGGRRSALPGAFEALQVPRGHAENVRRLNPVQLAVDRLHDTSLRVIALISFATAPRHAWGGRSGQGGHLPVLMGRTSPVSATLLSSPLDSRHLRRYATP